MSLGTKAEKSLTSPADFTSELAARIEPLEAKIRALEEKLGRLEHTGRDDASAGKGHTEEMGMNVQERLEKVETAVEKAVWAEASKQRKALRELLCDPPPEPALPLPPVDTEAYSETAKQVGSVSAAAAFLRELRATPAHIATVLSKLYPFHTGGFDYFAPAMVKELRVEECEEVVEAMGNFVAKQIVRKKLKVCVEELRKKVRDARKLASQSFVAAVNEDETDPIEEKAETDTREESKEIGLRGNTL